MTDFIVVGNMNACTCKEVFPLFKSGKVRLGYIANRPLLCKLPEDAEYYLKKDDKGNKLCKVNSVSWFVTFPVEKEPLVLSKTYNPTDYPKYDNYDAINVDRVKDIPCDYDGVMGVPVTILNYDLNNIEIVKFRKGDNDKDLCVNGEDKYFRVLIKKTLKLSE